MYNRNCMLSKQRPTSQVTTTRSLRRDLGLQLLALYLLFVIPVIVAALVFYFTSSSRLESDVKASDLSLARAIAHETDATLTDAIYTVQQLSKQPSVRNVDVAKLEVIFEDTANARPDVNLIYRLGSDGLMLFHYPVGPGSTLGVDFSFRKYFQDALLTEQAVISKGRISPTTEQAVATTVMPIRNATGEFLGVVATNIRLESLSEALSAISLEYQPEERFQVSIIDSTGQVIADPDPNRLLIPQQDDVPEVVENVLQGREGNLVLKDDEDTEWLNTYVPIPAGDWGVIVRRPTAVAFASINSFHKSLLAALGIFVIGGALFWIVLSRQVIRPLENLASFSQAIRRSPQQLGSERTKVALFSKRPDQMGSLVRSLMHMEESIEERFIELSTLLETSKAVVSTLDFRVVLDRILEQTSRLMGIDTCAIVALDIASEEFRVQASRGLSASYIQRLRIDPSEPNSPSMRAIKSGQPVQISNTETDSSYTRFRLRALNEGIRSLLAVPLVTKHAPPAVLIVYCLEPRVFNDREINLVWNFANHAAMAIENAVLYSRSDERLQEQTRRLEALIQSLADGLILEDLKGRVLYCNRSVCDLAEITIEEADRLSAMEIRERLIASSPEPHAVRTALNQALRDRGTRMVEWSIHRSDRPITLRLNTFAVTDSKGDIVGRGQIIQNITRDRELDRMKTSLITTASRELRTPLAAIKGFATTLLAEDVEWDREAQREFLSVISQETDRLSALATDLLDLSKIEGGNLIVQCSDCILSDLINNSIAQVRPILGHRLILDLEPEIPLLCADPRRIEVVIRNLIENAIKYGNSDTPIIIAAWREDSKVIVKVENEGPDIPPEYADRVFEPFFRPDESYTRKTSGAGLGLSICRGFISAHGGEIWHESNEKGTCIAFSLPIDGIQNDD